MCPSPFRGTRYDDYQIDPLTDPPHFLSSMLQATGMVQERVLAHEGITAAARDFLATKLQTSNVPVRDYPTHFLWSKHCLPAWL